MASSESIPLSASRKLEYGTREWDAAPERIYCLDCGRNVTASGQRCSLKDEVWARTGLGPWDGVLCLECIEARIGRDLDLADFRACRTRLQREVWGGRLMLPMIWGIHIERRGRYRRRGKAPKGG
jgi:hypothetical protein